jgi:polyisoprenyl-phosphate glycosyltransferase
VPYTPDPRAGGGSKWSLRKLIGLAVDGITSFSVMPLRVWSLFGALISLLSFAYGSWILFQTVFWGIDVPGYPSIMVAIVFLGGIQLVTLGVVGEYVGQVFMEVKRRPLYVIDEAVGFETKPGTDSEPSARSASPQ